MTAVVTRSDCGATGTFHRKGRGADLHEQADEGAVRESDLRDLADAWDRIDADLLPYT